MTGTELVAYAWKEWGLQALVLLSFTLQVTLLIFAEFRRSMDSSVLRAVLWSAYLLADSTAIYVLGHMSVITSSSRSPEHELMAFWAPFLLLHLGGQDNITAYAIEDNRLWLRHLQTFVVQVAAAAYVLYQSGILGGGRSSLLQQAAILMLVVGVVKYGERVWTLKCADSSPSGKNYRSFEPAGVAFSYNFDKTISLVTPATGVRDTESLLLTAHLTLDVAKELFKGRLPYGVDYRHVSDLKEEEVCKVVEMQLSLMHDVFYTKLQVTRSWYCLCVRVFAMLCTAVALLLFHLWASANRRHSKHSSRVDVGVTYALLVGAVILEMMWMFRAMFSSWTCALLAMRCNTSLVVSLRRLVRAAEWRRNHWSGSIGQQDLLELYARSKASKMSRIARCIGVEDTWNTLAYTGSSIPVSACIKQLLVKQVVKSKGVLVGSPDHILNSRGRAALNSFRLYDTLAWSVDDTNQLEEMIITWHIATAVYHRWYKDHREQTQQPRQADNLAKAAVALSNYMLYLLAARPDMLPPIASRNAFVETCFGLTCLVCASAEDLATIFHRYGDAVNTTGGPRFKFDTVVPVPAGISRSLENNRALKRGCRLGAILVSKEVELRQAEAGDSPAEEDMMLELIAEVWLEILCYAGHRCSADSHAKALSSGGELITVAALLLKYYITLGYLSQDPSERSGFSLQ
uniref:Uncharacterized protein n=1 Tax=Avena sativa TaxID=4498 RepID=A0ACD5YY63_AVESA